MSGYFFRVERLLFAHAEGRHLSRRRLEACDLGTRPLILPALSATLVIADITRAELISALNRRARDGSISEDEHQLLKAAFAMHLIRDYLLATVEPAQITAACELVARHALRAYDAVQLAVAVAVRRKLLGASAEPFRFVSADADLTAAAKAEGMSVVEP